MDNFMATTPHRNNSQALLEANYRCLLELFPELHGTEEMSCHAAIDALSISVDIQDQTPYTTLICLLLDFHRPHELLPAKNFSVRLYHDAKVAEVINFQGHGRLEPHYHYPNEKMYVCDEKRQLNRLLFETLLFCDKNGLRLPLPFTQIAI